MKPTMKEKILLLTTGLKSFAKGIASLFLIVSIFTLPLKLIYVWGCFLWNLL